MDTPSPPQPTQPAQPAPAAPAAPARRRLKKRWLIPGVILGALLVLLVWAFIRGTWADTTPRDPASPADGIITQLIKTPEGHKPVRCAVLLDHPLDEVWKAVTDYEHYGEIFP